MYPNEYIQYLVHFHGNRDYFECHEILEEYWKSVDAGNKDSVWVGFIQLAVSCYHHRRGNVRGAIKTLEKAIEIFSNDRNSLKDLAINKDSLMILLRKRLKIMEQNQSYHSFNLPITSPLLMQQCKTICAQKGFIWGGDSNMQNEQLVHRHKLRDRTVVILERDRAMKNKRSSE